jgi:hypothetical protein
LRLTEEEGTQVGRLGPQLQPPQEAQDIWLLVAKEHPGEFGLDDKNLTSTSSSKQQEPFVLTSTVD